MGASCIRMRFQELLPQRPKAKQKLKAGDGAHAGYDLFGVLNLVQGILRRLVFMLKTAILALSIL